MTVNEALLVTDNNRIRSPRKLRAAAEALASRDINTYSMAIVILLTRAAANERY